MAPSSPHDPAIRPPHPLARLAMERLASNSRILEFGTGSGRNAAAFRAAGFDVVALDDASASGVPQHGARAEFDAVVATHVLLHGTPDSIAQRLRWLSEALAGAGRLYATFGSICDARFGAGRRIDRQTYAPHSGDEAGVAHAYFSREELSGLLAPCFVVETLEEAGVDDVAGAWAHPTTPLRGAVHWFAVARRRRS